MTSYNFEPLKRSFPRKLIIVLVLAVVTCLGIGSLIDFSTGVLFAGYVTVSEIIVVAAVWNMTKSRAISRFAEANLLTVAAPDVPPCFDGVGRDAVAQHAYLLQVDGADCVVFDYTYVTGQGKSERTHSFGVAVMQNEKPYPHLFLDGHKNGASYAYQMSQRLGLEGDFDKYFSLYVPSGEQVAALSVLSPDVMQTLVNSGRPYDVEVSGTKLYVISKNSSYTFEKLPLLLHFMSNMKQEFAQKDVSWQPLILDTENWGGSASLRRSQRGLYLGIGIIMLIVITYLVVLLVTSNVIHETSPYGP